jgi:HEAT repeat protein
LSPWVYRISRHPQYLGWIIWSYGVFLLLLQARYPRRSWGISATLPWLISTMVIIGVAMLEEVNMRRRHGEEYETYRRSAPFLFPVPRFVEKAFALPFRILFKKARPERGREVAIVLTLYTALLIGASSLFYGGGWGRIASAFRSQEAQEQYLAGIVAEIRNEPNWRRQSALTLSLGPMGEMAIPSLLELLQDEDPAIRSYAAGTLRDYPSEAAFEVLTQAVQDEAEDVRWHAAEALGALRTPAAVQSLIPLLEDSASHIRMTALGALAQLGSEAVLPIAVELARAPELWVRGGGLGALGTLGSEEGLPTALGCLEDEDREVRIYAAEALKRLADR